MEEEKGVVVQDMAEKDCNSIRLYHITRPEHLSAILSEGIKGSVSACGKDEPFLPKREKAVYAHDRDTLQRVAHTYQRMYREMGSRPDDNPAEIPVVEFEVSTEHGYVGDLHRECSPGYNHTVMTLLEACTNEVFAWKYSEAEIIIPGKVIPPTAIRGTHKLSDFL